MNRCTIGQFLVAEWVFANICDVFYHFFCLIVVMDDKEIGCRGEVIQAIQYCRQGDIPL